MSETTETKTEEQRPVTEAPKTEPAKPDAAALEARAVIDVKERQQRRERDVARGKLIDKYGDALDLLEKGNDVDAVQRLLGDKFSGDWLLKATEKFPALPDPKEDLDGYVEGKTKQLLTAAQEAEQRRKDEAEREREAASLSKYEETMDKFVDAADAYLKANGEQFPGIEVYGVTGDEVEEEFLAHLKQTGVALELPELLKAIDAKKSERLSKTRFGKVLTPGQQTAAKETEPTLSRTPPPREAPVSNRKLSEDEQIIENLKKYDRASKERAALNQRRSV